MVLKHPRNLHKHFWLKYKGDLIIQNYTFRELTPRNTGKQINVNEITPYSASKNLFKNNKDAY